MQPRVPSSIRRVARYSTDAAEQQDFHALVMRVKEGLKDTYPTSQTFWLTLCSFGVTLGGGLWGATQWGISHQLEGVRLDVKQMGLNMDESMLDMNKRVANMERDVAEIKELVKKAFARA